MKLLYYDTYNLIFQVPSRTFPILRTDYQLLSCAVKKAFWEIQRQQPRRVDLPDVEDHRLMIQQEICGDEQEMRDRR